MPRRPPDEAVCAGGRGGCSSLACRRGLRERGCVPRGRCGAVRVRLASRVAAAGMRRVWNVRLVPPSTNRTTPPAVPLQLELAVRCVVPGHCSLCRQPRLRRNGVGGTLVRHRLRPSRAASTRTPADAVDDCGRPAGVSRGLVDRISGGAGDRLQGGGDRRLRGDAPPRGAGPS